MSNQHRTGITDPHEISRRWFLAQCGVGLGSVALGHLLGEGGLAAARQHGSDPLAPRAPHYAPKAKNVIFLFMAGAPSHLELLDHKPELTRFDGTMPPAELLEGYRAAFIDPHSHAAGSQVQVQPPRPMRCRNIGGAAPPRQCRRRHCHCEIHDHRRLQPRSRPDPDEHRIPAVRPGPAWGPGSPTAWEASPRDLPAFVVFSSGSKGPSGGNACWGSGFLPTVHQGVTFRSAGEPVLYLSNPKGVDSGLQKASLDAVRDLNRMRLQAIGDPEIATRINSFEMAFRMQSSVPDLMDISTEPQSILDLYGAEPGKSSYANNCLLARRLVERGVRFVQLFHESWDQHADLTNRIQTNCKDTDQPSAALIKDLKQRGLLDETLVLWGGEFGRTPMVQGPETDGRDHHPNAFAVWLAGGGIRPGTTLGETDELGFNVVKDKVHVHDLHATILHLLGFDHTRLTHRFQGRDFRLTDVHGTVVKQLLA